MQKYFLADLLGSQYLFEMLQTSLTVKNKKNVVKNGCLEKRLRWMFLKTCAMESTVFFNSRKGVRSPV